MNDESLALIIFFSPTYLANLFITSFDQQTCSESLFKYEQIYEEENFI